MPFSPKDKADEIRRELNLRRAVFTRLVSNGSLPAKEAARRIALMEEILADYRALAEAEEAKERLI